MRTRVYTEFNPQKALIWRIIHRDNLPWILEHGLHAGNSAIKSDSWVHIGNEELIGKRSRLEIPVGKQGVLNDYVPFYFTPFSPMLYNVCSGRGGVTKRKPEDILILVSNLHRVAELELDYVFTDMHAYYHLASFYTDLAELNKIDWPLLQNRDFKRDSNDLQKFERYQAEALIYGHCPLEALQGVVCYNDAVQKQVESQLQNVAQELKVITRPRWYFS